MRWAVAIVVSVGVWATTMPARAQVRLAVKKDGSKVIFNVGGGPGGKGSNLDWLARQHDRRSPYDKIIEHYAAKYGVDATFVRAVIQVESNFNPNCVSHKGARGLMQLMPGTARRYGVKNVHDPEENIRGGVAYLADLMRLFRGDLQRVLAGYNAGENAVLRYGGIPPYQETTTYVKRALTVYYGRPYEGGGSTSFAGARGGPKLRGGVKASMVQPLAALPGMRVLSSQ